MRRRLDRDRPRAVRAGPPPRASSTRCGKAPKPAAGTARFAPRALQASMARATAAALARDDELARRVVIDRLHDLALGRFRAGRLDRPRRRDPGSRPWRRSRPARHAAWPRRETARARSRPRTRARPRRPGRCIRRGCGRPACRAAARHGRSRRARRRYLRPASPAGCVRSPTAAPPGPAGTVPTGRSPASATPRRRSRRRPARPPRAPPACPPTASPGPETSSPASKCSPSERIARIIG